MPRPGPRPYVCERRAWHSDRHQPFRGSLIQEIFRVVNEIHSSATKKNKEWQEKLPVVVLKAEEIMYSKANSEAEYMDIKTLWDRTNDAINTIIRRDESTETGQFLQPCIEAALNLGCPARRTLRSQRNCSPQFYLNPGTQEAANTTRGNLLTNSHFMANCSSFMNVTDMSSEKQPPSLYSCYPLSHENHLKVEELPHECGKYVSNTVEPAKMSGIHDLHEIACDLSLRLGPLSTPCLSGGNSRSKEIEVTGSTYLEWNEFGHLTSPAQKSLSSFPKSSRDAPLSSSSNEWSVEGGHIWI